MGPHWSKYRQSAEDWVTGVSRDNTGEPESQRGVTGLHGVVLEGRASKKHLVKPGDSDDNLESYGSFGSDSREKETTVRPGGTVKVKKIHTLAVNKNENDFNTASVIGSKRVNKKAKVIERPRESYKKK